MEQKGHGNLSAAGERSDIMTAAEVAVYLRMNKKTVLVHARAGVIPCKIIGDRLFRFSRKAIEALLEARPAVDKTGRAHSPVPTKKG
jgi:excisionase family DNA binding protein